MNLKSQVQSQYNYALSHKGKAIGSALGIVAGVSYGLAGKKDNWIVAGLAIGGAIGGAILGGMFDKAPTVVVPVDSNGTAKAPVVNDTAGMETANDTAGDDGMMSNAIGCGGKLCNCTFTDSNGMYYTKTVDCIPREGGRCGCPNYGTRLDRGSSAGSIAQGGGTGGSLNRVSKATLTPRIGGSMARRAVGMRR
jgi:hypothetical protein